MSDNLLTPGFAGAVSPKPGDESANPPVAGNSLSPGASRSSAAPPTKMQQHYSSQEEQARLRFDKVKEAWGQMQTMREALDKLAAFGDTVTTDDVVDAAASMVAGGIPAVQVAGSLADMPEQSAQLQAWVQQQGEKLKPKEAQIYQALQAASHALGSAALKGLIVHSAEEHFAKQRLAAMTPRGRA